MPVNFTGVDTWRATITAPANGDTVTGPSVADMGELLADRTLYLYNRLISGYEVRIEGYSAVSRDLKASSSWLDAGTVTLDTGLDVGDLILVSWHGLTGYEKGPATTTMNARIGLSVAGGAYVSLWQTSIYEDNTNALYRTPISGSTLWPVLSAYGDPVVIAIQGQGYSSGSNPTRAEIVDGGLWVATARKLV
jgi:hypothetical protein